jgi:hypothetical protein
MLTPEQLEQAVKEFKALFKREYGIELSDEEATERAKGILSILAVAFKADF